MEVNPVSEPRINKGIFEGDRRIGPNWANNFDLNQIADNSGIGFDRTKPEDYQNMNDAHKKINEIENSFRKPKHYNYIGEAKKN